MSARSDITGALAFDTQSLDQLKLQAKRDPKQAIGAVSKQFEVLFLNLVLKSMREAVPQDGMFDSEQTRLFTSMLDQQLAQNVAGRGIGLAEVMARQLSRNAVGFSPAAATPAIAPAGSVPSQPTNLPSPSVPLPRGEGSMTLPSPPGRRAGDEGKDAVAGSRGQIEAHMPWRLLPGDERSALPDLVSAPLAKARELMSEARPTLPASPPVAPAALAPSAGTPLPLEQTRDFVNRVWKYAADAARTTGIQPHFMVGQAALESGWGRHEIRASDGTLTHNLFGIKAGRGWSGPVVEKATTEFVNGVAQTTIAKFRVYESYAEGFRDYAQLLRSNPRYEAVLNQAQDATSFARGLQQAGYATDPAYADKLVRVINGETLRRSLSSFS